MLTSNFITYTYCCGGEANVLMHHNVEYMISVAIDCRTFRIPTNFQDCTVVKTKHYNATELYTLLQGVFYYDRPNTFLRKFNLNNDWIFIRNSFVLQKTLQKNRPYNLGFIHLNIINCLNATQRRFVAIFSCGL